VRGPRAGRVGASLGSGAQTSAARAFKRLSAWVRANTIRRPAVHGGADAGHENPDEKEMDDGSEDDHAEYGAQEGAREEKP